MKYFRFIAILSIAALLLSACNVSSANSPTQVLSAPTRDEAAELPTPTSQPVEQQASATAPATAADGKLISKNGVTFTIPTGLGTDATGSIVAETVRIEDAPPNGNPAYMQFKLQGYPVAPANDYFYAGIEIYDAQAYAADFAMGASNSKALNALLAAPDAALTQQVMPPSYLTMASNMKRLSSANVKGVRMLSLHGNGMPIATNKDLSYQFHGLTADGKFYIIVNLPITAPFLPESYDSPADEGLIMFPKEISEKAVPDYLAKVSNLLGQAETAGSLSPSVAQMDALVQSLQINASEILLPAPLPTNIPAVADATATTTPVKSGLCDAVGFLKDVTYPDGTQVKPGETFTKTWRIKNQGTCTWEGNYTLVFYSGEQMDGASPTVASAAPNTVAPGGQIDVSIEMKAPSKEETYIGWWALKNSKGEYVPMATGEPFQISVNIVVSKESGNSSGAGAITGVNIRVEDEQGSGGKCTAGTSYFVYLKVTSDGATTAQYRISATDGSGQVANGVFDTFDSSEVTDSLTFSTAETKMISLRLMGPYGYPKDITLRTNVNGKWYETVVCP